MQLKKLKQIDDSEKNNDGQIKDGLILTPFYYTEINKKNQINSNHKNDSKINNKTICIELPKII